MQNAEEFNARLSNCIGTLQAMKGRTNIFQGDLAKVEELAEIGLLTMRLAELEELISLFCEALLIRPELGGSHPPKKLVLTKQLTEKLTLYQALTTASGVLYAIDTELVHKSIARVRSVGEDRDTIIHGLFDQLKPHPALSVEVNAIAAITRIWHLLGYDVSAPGPIGRPAGK